MKHYNLEEKCDGERSSSSVFNQTELNGLAVLISLMSGIRRSSPRTGTIAVVSRHYGGVIVDPATQVEEGTPSRSADPYSLDDETTVRPQAAYTCIAIAVQLLRLIAVICRLSVLKCCCLVACGQNSARDVFPLTGSSVPSFPPFSPDPQHFARFK